MSEYQTGQCNLTAGGVVGLRRRRGVSWGVEGSQQLGGGHYGDVLLYVSDAIPAGTETAKSSLPQTLHLDTPDCRIPAVGEGEGEGGGREGGREG